MVKKLVPAPPSESPELPEKVATAIITKINPSPNSEPIKFPANENKIPLDSGIPLFCEPKYPPIDERMGVIPMKTIITLNI
jgi:hypothetical protein